MITVASLLQIMTQVGSLDLSRDLQPIRAKKFTNRFYLVFYACVQIFDVIFFWCKILRSTQGSPFLKPNNTLDFFFQIQQQMRHHYAINYKQET